MKNNNFTSRFGMWISEKTILASAMFLFANFTLAQEAGKAGQLLENKAKVKSRNNTEKPNNNALYRNRNFGNNEVRNPSQFRWNYNYGYSEVFLRIPENGYFTVEIGDQMMSNASGKFRFFDLPSGNLPISIYADDFLIYNTIINVKNNARTVLDFFSNYGLYLLDVYPVQTKTYGYNQWDDVWNRPYQNNGNTDFYRGNDVMTDEQFAGFMAQLRNNNFDNDRVSFINAQMEHNWFTAKQIYEMVKQISFDEKKLNIAQKAYHKCVDRKNFYLVYDAFDFDSYKRRLMNYVSGVR